MTTEDNSRYVLQTHAASVAHFRADVNRTAIVFVFFIAPPRRATGISSAARGQDQESVGNGRLPACRHHLEVCHMSSVCGTILDSVRTSESQDTNAPSESDST